MKFLPSPIQKSVVAALPLLLAAAHANEDVLLPAAKECDPKKAELRSTSTSVSCGPDSHCVLNGHSSLGGYCINNDNKAAHMDMPEALRALCFVCESPDDPNTIGSVVTMHNQIVGSFTCGELEGMGRQGEIPSDQCQIFQKMIRANDLCGCTEVVKSEDEEDSVAVEAAPQEYDDDVVEVASQGDDDVYFYTNQPPPSTEDSNFDPFDPFGLSGGSSKSMAITAAASAITLLLTLW